MSIPFLSPLVSRRHLRRGILKVAGALNAFTTTNQLRRESMVVCWIDCWIERSKRQATYFISCFGGCSSCTEPVVIFELQLLICASCTTRVLKRLQFRAGAAKVYFACYT